MLRVTDLRALSHFSAQALVDEIGPFALIQRPPDPVLARVAMEMSAVRTVAMAHRSRLAEQILTMLRGFDDLLVVTPKGRRDFSSLTIGRHSDSDLVVHEPSVSHRHATLRWSARDQRAFVCDLGSTNGTFLNTRPLMDEETELSDGDTLCFGDAQFMFLLSETLHAQLGGAGSLKPPRGR
ncbi:MAG: FHA domain-containing protein [Myxococcaceae bacterium]